MIQNLGGGGLVRLSGEPKGGRRADVGGIKSSDRAWGESSRTVRGMGGGAGGKAAGGNIRNGSKEGPDAMGEKTQKK